MDGSTGQQFNGARQASVSSAAPQFQNRSSDGRAFANAQSSAPPRDLSAVLTALSDDIDLAPGNSGSNSPVQMIRQLLAEIMALLFAQSASGEEADDGELQRLTQQVRDSARQAGIALDQSVLTLTQRVDAQSQGSTTGRDGAATAPLVSASSPAVSQVSTPEFGATLRSGTPILPSSFGNVANPTGGTQSVAVNGQVSPQATSSLVSLSEQGLRVAPQPVVTTTALPSAAANAPTTASAMPSTTSVVPEQQSATGIRIAPASSAVVQPGNPPTLAPQQTAPVNVAPSVVPNPQASPAPQPNVSTTPNPLLVALGLAPDMPGPTAQNTVTGRDGGVSQPANNQTAPVNAGPSLAAPPQAQTAPAPQPNVSPTPNPLLVALGLAPDMAGSSGANAASGRDAGTSPLGNSPSAPVIPAGMGLASSSQGPASASASLLQSAPVQASGAPVAAPPAQAAGYGQSVSPLTGTNAVPVAAPATAMPAMPVSAAAAMAPAAMISPVAPPSAPTLEWAGRGADVASSSSTSVMSSTRSTEVSTTVVTTHRTESVVSMATTDTSRTNASSAFAHAQSSLVAPASSTPNSVPAATLATVLNAHSSMSGEAVRLTPSTMVSPEMRVDALQSSKNGLTSVSVEPREAARSVAATAMRSDGAAQSLPTQASTTATTTTRADAQSAGHVHGAGNGTGKSEASALQQGLPVAAASGATVAFLPASMDAMAPVQMVSRQTAADTSILIKAAAHHAGLDEDATRLSDKNKTQPVNLGYFTRQSIAHGRTDPRDARDSMAAGAQRAGTLPADSPSTQPVNLRAFVRSPLSGTAGGGQASMRIAHEPVDLARQMTQTALAKLKKLPDQQSASGTAHAATTVSASAGLSSLSTRAEALNQLVMQKMGYRPSTHPILMEAGEDIPARFVDQSSYVSEITGLDGDTFVEDPSILYEAPMAVSPPKIDVSLTPVVSVAATQAVSPVEISSSAEIRAADEAPPEPIIVSEEWDEGNHPDEALARDHNDTLRSRIEEARHQRIWHQELSGMESVLMLKQTL